MTLSLIALLLGGIALPHMLRLDRSAPMAAAIMWTVSLVLRALLVVFGALYLAFFLPTTGAFAQVTHWCWHTVVPLLTTHLGLDGHRVGDAATIVPGLLAMASLLSVALGVARGARAVKRLLTRHSLGPGPADTVIVAGREVMMAAAGLKRPKVVVSAGALLQLDDDELAAGLDHERGHIARRHRYMLVFAELCRGVGRIVPGAVHASRQLAFHLERDADQWALRRHDRLALASAICKAASTQPLDAVVASASLSGTGAPERLGQLVDGSTAPVRGARAMMLNAAAAAMVCAALVAAAVVPSTALAGAGQLNAQQQVRHCEG
jgi:hypothetical protein